MKAGTWFDIGALSGADNRRDLVIGAPGGPGLFGTVHVIYGGPIRSGLVSLSNSDVLITGEAAGDLFGTSTAVGSILFKESLEPNRPKNLLIGAPGGLGARGAVYLFVGSFGSNDVLNTSGAVYKIIGAPGDQLGTTLATTDLDNDGYREIVIGAPGTHRVYVIKGGPSLSGVRDLATTPPSGAGGVTIDLAGIGNVMTSGDVDGDDIQDLLLGAPTLNAIHLFTGRNGSFPTTASAVFAGLDSGDLTGSSIRLADMDADGRRDILIGAPGGDGADNTRTDAGEVYLIWGGGPQVSRNLLNADVTFYGLPGERLGSFMTMGDINRDIPNDVVMLAGGPAAASGTGILYIYYGRPRAEFGSANPNGTRVVDFTIPGQVSRRIGSDPTIGPIRAAQVFEVTGEGARDVIVGVPGFASNTGRVYFTLSPKLTLSSTDVKIFAHRGASKTTNLGVLNPTSLSITWSVSASTASWLSFSPSSGSAVDGIPGSIALTASTAGLAARTYTTSITVSSTSPDLTMSLTVPVTLVVTDTTVHLDGPLDNSTVSQPFNIGGWALDFGATTDVGVDAIHIWAFPVSGASPVFLGVGNTGNPRPDVGAAYGHQFDNSGFNLQVTGMTPGQYYIAVYAHNSASGEFDATQVVTVTVVSSARMSVDVPQTGSALGPEFFIGGWAIDAAGGSGTGVDAIHIWAFPRNGAAATFLGVAVYGDPRPDVGAAFGARFTNSGFHLNATGLAPGAYTVVVYAHSSVTGSFDNSRGFDITVQQSMSLDVPANGGSVTRPFLVGGWAIDLASVSGTGVDTVHVWAQPTNGGAAVFLGVASYGNARGDVGAVYGARFTNSAFNLTVPASALTPGTYTITAYAHSTVANAFNDLRAATVTVQ